MANRPIGELAGAVQDEVTTIAGDIAVLAKSELGRDGIKIGVGIALFGAAIGGGALAGVLVAIAIAQALMAVGLAPWVAYLVDVAIVLVSAVILGLAGRLLLGRVTGPVLTLRALRGLASALRGRPPAGPGFPPRPPSGPDPLPHPPSGPVSSSGGPTPRKPTRPPTAPATAPGRITSQTLDDPMRVCGSTS